MADSALDLAGWVWPGWQLTVAAPDRDFTPVLVVESASDAELVQATLAGSREAFDQIVLRHRKAVYRLCYRYVGRHEDANDLAQDVFLRAYRGLKQFKGRSSLTTWLYRIGTNVCLNQMASKASRRERPEPFDVLDRVGSPDENPADAFLREERARRVRAAIAQLPPRQRATLVLRVYQDLSHEEIASVLGTSVGACKANLFHALKKLKRMLQPPRAEQP